MSKTWRLVKMSEPVFVEMGFEVDVLDLKSCVATARSLANRVNWYQAPTGLKAMMDRLVCADGGNPDPSSTQGKRADEAKALELKGWSYPRHLASRNFGIVIHGDSVGAETLRRSLSDWLTDMCLVSSGRAGEADGYLGYMEPYATSHTALDEDTGFQQEVSNVARALGNAVTLARAGRLVDPGRGLSDAAPK